MDLHIVRIASPTKRQGPNPEKIMNGDMFGHCHDKWNLRLDGFFNGFGCLVSRYVNSGRIWFGFLLSL